jgi:tryptophan 7-halogenase
VNNNFIREILIVGGGTAGWMAAATFARTLPPGQVRVRLIESEEIGIIGVGEATVPLMHIFNGLLGLDEREFVCATQGTFKLGIEFVDWGRIGNRHFHGFSDFGEHIQGIAPHHYWLKLHEMGDPTPLSAHSFATVLAMKNRFAPSSVRGGEAEHYKYAYQFDASLYAKFLRRYSERLGIERIEGRIADVSQRSEDGFVEAVTTADGRRFEADLFIDCTGFAGLLIEKTLNIGYEDWSKWLPCDRAVAAPCESAGEVTPYTRATALEAGWQWRIPLQHRTGNGYVYSTAFVSDELAEQTLLANLEGKPLADPRILRFTPGHRRKLWNKNVVALGLASGFLEPLESTSIMQIQTGLARLVQMFPTRDCDPAIADEYNRMAVREYEQIRDFIIAHYCITKRTDSELWRYVGAMELPDSLRRKLDMFFARGVAPIEGDEAFHEPSWVSILFGQEAYPKGYDPLIERVPLDQLKAGMANRCRDIDRLSDRLPLHSEFIARTCPAPAIAA